MAILDLRINDENRDDLISYLKSACSAAEGEPKLFIGEVLSAIDSRPEGFEVKVSDDNALALIGLLQESGTPSLIGTAEKALHSMCSAMAIEAMGLDGIFNNQ
jgi:hypothetical protein